MTGAFISNLRGYLDAYNRTAASAALSLLRLHAGISENARVIRIEAHLKNYERLIDEKFKPALYQAAAETLERTAADFAKDWVAPTMLVSEGGAA